MNGFKGFVGYSIRELTQNEMNSYCNNKTDFLVFSQIQTPVNFTSDFMVRSYTSGCYYYDTITGKWYSDGMDVYEDTNLEQTHCMTNHLTSFAGGFVFTQSTLNIEYAFVNTLMAKSLLAILFIIVITCIYILFAIWSRYMDIQDVKKLNLVPLKDNHRNDSYFYEIIVFTGTISESGTKSKVKFDLNSQK